MTAERRTLRVFVADDHPLYRKAVVEAVKAHPALALAGEAADGRAALKAIRAILPDVAVVDVQMPLLDGLGVLDGVRRESLATRVVLLTAELDAAGVCAAIAAGAAGCLFKDIDVYRLSDAILAVGRGELVLAPEVQGAVAGEIGMRSADAGPLLTARELEILGLIAEGLSAPAVAERLVVSPATVRTHLQHLYEKLGVSDRAAAVAEAMRRGIIE
ncbi:MAG: response regulator transcription factor [Thermoleophilia bacterium]